MNTIKDLYEIDLRLEQCVDQETGELLDAEAFEALYDDRLELIDRLASWAKKETALAEDIKDEMDALGKRYKAKKKRADDLKKLLDHFLDGSKFESAKNVVTFRRTEAVEVVDGCALIEWAQTSGFDDCLRYRAPEISKAAVKELLKAGKAVPGACLEARRSVVIK